MNVREKIVLLDLEETIIDDWGSGIPLCFGFNRVSKFLATFKNWIPDSLGVMSWAIYNDKDKLSFETRFREMIENGLSCKLDNRWILSMDDWGEMLKSVGKVIPREEMFDLFKKEEVLLLLSRKSDVFKNKEIFLIDDRVDHNLMFDIPSNNCKVTFLNVNEMSEE